MMGNIGTNQSLSPYSVMVQFPWICTRLESNLGIDFHIVESLCYIFLDTSGYSNATHITWEYSQIYAGVRVGGPCHVRGV